VDVGQALERDTTLDIEQYIRDEYAPDSQPFFVLLTDGRTFEIGARFPQALLSEARARLNGLRNIDPSRLARGGPFGRGGPFRPGERGGPQIERGAAGAPPGRGRFAEGPVPPGQDRGVNEDNGSRRRRSAGDPAPDRDNPGVPRGGPPAFRTGRPWPILANGRLVGVVVVPPQPPFTFLLERYAPTLVTVAGVTLIVGGVIAALLVFGPTRRRLKAVEDAARRLGSGDLTARAPAGGEDEVAAVATAFNAMAADLAARTEALVAADRARRQLLADVSHELNTPVTAMRGYLETLSMPELGLDDATRARYLTIVRDETARLERIIGDLLDLARLEGGGGSLEVERIQVHELFARVLARHERTAESARVRILTEVDSGADTIAADRTRLEQALQNVAANALRYAPEDTTVRLRSRNDGDSVALLISDEGPGIPREHLPRVFDRFYKVDGSRAAQAAGGGSGLGLSIVKAIVERHGARISVASGPGRTVFEITGLRKDA
jgi:signal transduction histidine kinase